MPAAGLLSPFGPCGQIIRMVSSGELSLCFDARILAEYEAVLGSLPDPDDEPFLEVAIAAHAEFLVTGNRIHFPSDRCQNVTVLSPGEFLAFYKNTVTAPVLSL